MSHAFSSHMAAAPVGDSASMDSTLLTPPLTPQSDYEIPYKPTMSDHLSLNQKKKNHKHMKGFGMKREQRQGTTPLTADVSVAATSGRPQSGGIHRSQSESIIRRRSTLEVSPRGSLPVTHSLAPKEDRSRRWTLPFKSNATRAVTEVESTVKHATLRSKQESPAMITLRRATTSKTRRGTSLTFFPPPVFERQGSGLLNYLISTLSGSVKTTRSFVLAGGDMLQDSPRDLRVQIPTFGHAAPTVCTETTVWHEVTVPGDEARITPRRRCSSKFVSNNQIFEVIWDENDSLTSSQETSRSSVGGSGDGGVSSRKRSMAVEQLEIQMVKSEAASRQSSQGASQRVSRRGSYTASASILNSQVLARKLSQTFSRLTHELALQNLPRSKGKGNQASSIETSLSEPVQYQFTDDSKFRLMSTIEFFPPLSSRQGSYQRSTDRRLSDDSDEEVVTEADDGTDTMPLLAKHDPNPPAEVKNSMFARVSRRCGTLT